VKIILEELLAKDFETARDPRATTPSELEKLVEKPPKALMIAGQAFQPTMSGWLESLPYRMINIFHGV
jgi:hypothetical protein